MRKTLNVLALVMLSASVFAGDDASGPIKYQADFGQSFTSHSLTDADRAWAASLVSRMKYKGEIVYFARTNIPLEVDGARVDGAIYESIEMPGAFYVIPGDAMLVIGARWPYSPGTGGFSMFIPRSRSFIACLNCRTAGVPFLSSSPVVRGLVSWGGRDYRRF